MRIRFVIGSLIALVAVAPSRGATPLGTAFTYQGQLKDAGSPASGLHDLRFRLYDALTVGAQVGATVCINNVSVTNGLFTVPLDFGAQFAGQERFLEIDVRADSGRDCTNSAGFIILAPRQAMTAAPHALFALNAASATNATLLDNLDSTAFLQSIPVPLTLSGTSAPHIIRAENSSTGLLPLAVYGRCTAATVGSTGVRGESASTSGRGRLRLCQRPHRRHLRRDGGRK